MWQCNVMSPSFVSTSVLFPCSVAPFRVFEEHTGTQLKKNKTNRYCVGGKRQEWGELVKDMEGGVEIRKC